MIKSWSYRHQNFTVHQLPAYADNYIYLIEEHNSQLLAAVDPGDAEVVQKACESFGKPLTHILNTHHHWDHTDGNSMLKSSFNCRIIGSEADADRIPDIDVMVGEGKFTLGELTGSVLFVPGHTRGHIAFVIDDALFCGDTLFGAGCGRLFEGTHAQMWDSLSRLAALPDNTKVYCAHEYTLANLRFAAGVDDDNSELQARIENDSDKRLKNLPTIPSSIGMERRTNPFLRPLDRSFCSDYARRQQVDDAPLAVFTDIRRRKDRA